MSGFAAEWLAVREPVDRRSRSAALTRRTAGWAFARFQRTGRALRIADLGAGSGSNPLFLAPYLPVPQEWVLLDDDPALLRVAAERCRVLSTRNGLTIAVQAVDLAKTDLHNLLQGFDLITASALFDLVSAPWCTALLAAAKHQHVGALLAVLTYDGRMSWQETNPFDAGITALVNRHQGRDKGFGPALGPRAAHFLTQAAKATGALVVTERSDWCVGAADAHMHAMVLRMLKEAAVEVGPAQAGGIGDWFEWRLERTAKDGVTIGHVDLLATW